MTTVLALSYLMKPCVTAEFASPTSVLTAATGSRQLLSSAYADGTRDLCSKAVGLSWTPEGGPKRASLPRLFLKKVEKYTPNNIINN